MTVPVLLHSMLASELSHKIDSVILFVQVPWAIPVPNDDSQSVSAICYHTLVLDVTHSRLVLEIQNYYVQRGQDSSFGALFLSVPVLALLELVE